MIEGPPDDALVPLRLPIEPDVEASELARNPGALLEGHAHAREVFEAIALVLPSGFHASYHAAWTSEQGALPGSLPALTADELQTLKRIQAALDNAETNC